MVGTIEPRKGYAQVLEAFELLWQAGYQCQLVIVGKPGWNVEQLVSKLIDHKEKGQRLFWLQVISDEYLSLIYQNAVCLLAASEGEGFGLPLIESVCHGIPILARDIEVFREVGQGHASYFSASHAKDLCLAIESWLRSRKQNMHIESDGLPTLTWAQCSENIINYLVRI